MKLTDVLMLWDAGCIDDDKLMLLLTEDKDEPYHKKYDQFELDSLENLECRNMFRFDKENLPVLCKVLSLKDDYKSSTCVKWSGLEGLCLMLCRLAYPNCLSDLVPIFGHGKSECSIILNAMLDEMVVKHSHHVGTVLQPWLNHTNMTNIVQNKGAAVDNVWAFLDGTHIPICRPSRDQRSVFGGHKHCH